MSERAELAQTAAQMYYLNLETMDAIAHALGVSRSTVSRLLAYARETGIVRITVDSRIKTDTALALEDRFGVSVTTVSFHRPLTAVAKLAAVSRVAAEKLSSFITPGQVLGLAWGNTTSEVLRQMRPVGKLGLRVVQMNGSASSLQISENQHSDQRPGAAQLGYTNAEAVLSKAAEVLSADVIQFPVPAFFDFAETKAAMWRERSVKRVLAAIEGADLALFGVGAFAAELPSLVYSGGYMDPAQIRQLSQAGVVGDVCTVLLRADGSWADIDMNQRASGPTPHTLLKIPTRFAVVSGVSKAPALLGALRARVITDLVVDEETAERTLRLAAPERRR